MKIWMPNMKVKTWVETWVDVDVSIEDVMNEMRSLPISISTVPPAGTLPRQVLEAINIAFGVLKRISTEHIAVMSAGQRGLILNALHEQAERYKEKKID